MWSERSRCPRKCNWQERKVCIRSLLDTESRTTLFWTLSNLQVTIRCKGVDNSHAISAFTGQVSTALRQIIQTVTESSDLVTTSGAIQYGVPTIVDRLLCSADNCAQNPKSAADTHVTRAMITTSSSVAMHFQLLISHVLFFTITRYWCPRSRHKIHWHPFPRESVGSWRKDEFQWMSLALIGDRKSIRPQKFCSHYPLVECTFPPLLFLHRRLFSCLRTTWWEGVEEDVCRGRIKGNWLNQVQLEGQLLNTSMCDNSTLHCPLSTIYCCYYWTVVTSFCKLS